MPPLSRRLVLGVLPFLAGPAFAGSAPSPAAPRSGSEYVALGDFTVNLPTTGRRHQYLLVAVSVEVQADAAQTFRDLNPRLREAVLLQLMTLSHRGQLKPGVIDPGALRDELFASLSRVRSDGLKSVVITRMMHS